FFFQAEDGIRDFHVTGVQTCALPIFPRPCLAADGPARRAVCDEGVQLLHRLFDGAVRLLAAGPLDAAAAAARAGGGDGVRAGLRDRPVRGGRPTPGGPSPAPVPLSAAGAPAVPAIPPCAPRQAPTSRRHGSPPAARLSAAGRSCSRAVRSRRGTRCARRPGLRAGRSGPAPAA